MDNFENVYKIGFSEREKQKLPLKTRTNKDPGDSVLAHHVGSPDRSAGHLASLAVAAVTDQGVPGAPGPKGVPKGAKLGCRGSHPGPQRIDHGGPRS